MPARLPTLAAPALPACRCLTGRRCSARRPWLAGNWSLDTTLAAGTYNNLKVTVTDLAGNATTTTNAQTIIVDATPPSETFPTVTLTSDSGASNATSSPATAGCILPARLPTLAAPALPACRCLMARRCSARQPWWPATGRSTPRWRPAPTTISRSRSPTWPAMPPPPPMRRPSSSTPRRRARHSRR